MKLADVSRARLPEPTPEALEHQKKLLEHLSQLFERRKGVIPFADFMHQALYAPGLGYYSAGSLKFGSQGDFVTAPEISALFGECLAHQCEQILTHLRNPTRDNEKQNTKNNPIKNENTNENINEKITPKTKDIAPAIILELGAGSGKMASDLLKALARTHALPCEYWILEVSADLKSRQQAWLNEHNPEYFSKIRWLDSLPQEPFKGVILANEVLDAMPVHVFQIHNNQILEGMVTTRSNSHDKSAMITTHANSNDKSAVELDINYQWQYDFRPSETPQFEQQVKDLLDRLPHALPHPYISEVNLGLNGWVKSLSECFAQGVMLFIDYGFPMHEYYHPSRHMGTLMCHYRHHPHSDPFKNVGLQDITAHVDFTALALAAEQYGLTIEGFTHQAGFLLDNDLMGIAEKYTHIHPIKLSQQIQQLTQPHEMGELFKVMALGKNVDFQLDGFRHFDQRHRL